MYRPPSNGPPMRPAGNISDGQSHPPPGLPGQPRPFRPPAGNPTVSIGSGPGISQSGGNGLQNAPPPFRPPSYVPPSNLGQPSAPRPSPGFPPNSSHLQIPRQPFNPARPSVSQQPPFSSMPSQPVAPQHPPSLPTNANRQFTQSPNVPLTKIEGSGMPNGAVFPQRPTMTPPLPVAPPIAGFRPGGPPPIGSRPALTPQPIGPPGSQPSVAQRTNIQPPGSYPNRVSPPFGPPGSRPVMTPQSIGPPGSLSNATPRPASGPPGLQSNMTPPPPGPFSGHPRPTSPKIDPSQMPRPSHKDTNVPIPFETRHNGHHYIPPMACVRTICHETGNCDPKFMRLSLNHIPSNSELYNNASLPLVVFMQPLAIRNSEEEPITVLDFGESGPVRCGRCRAYMNPFMSFQDGGRSFVCPFCNVKNETPGDYFCYLGPDGKRRDVQDRPELSKGTVEFVAPPSFLVRPPMPPIHFFLIDATTASVSSGALYTVCNSVKAVLDSIQGQDRARIGIATFDSSIHFYHVKNADGSPQISIVPDIMEVFSPSPDLLMSLQEQKDTICEILDMIPKLYENQTVGESCAGAAIEAVIEALKPTGGKLHAILTTRPTKGNRSLKPRDMLSAQSAEKNDKEKQLNLLPQDNTYRTLGLHAAEFFISIDLFCLAQHYIDVSTFSVLSNTTGGSVYFYDNFAVHLCGHQFLNDLKWNLARPQGMEGVLRLRCSTGLDIENYLGSMAVRNQHEIELPSIDSDKSVMAKIVYNDRLPETGETYFQCALLYTTTSGQRRIRVSTLGIPITTNINQVFRGVDLEAYMNYLSRRVSVTLPGNTLQIARDIVSQGCIGALAAYRKWCVTSSSSGGQLILPDSLKLLPLYTLGLTKSVALRSDAKLDERSAFFAHLLSLPCSKILNLVYGRFFMLDPILESDQIVVPDSLNLSSEHLRESKLFLFENGYEIMVKVESQVPSETLQALFGISQVNIKGPDLTVIISDHPKNVKMQKLLNELRMRVSSYMSLRVALRSTPLESRFLGFLVDDRNSYGQSYVEHLCSVHRSIQNKLA